MDLGEWAFDGSFDVCDPRLQTFFCDSFQKLYEHSHRIENVDMFDFSSSGWIWAGVLFYTPICLLGVLGNFLTVLIFCKYIRKTTTATFIITLAVIDLVICLTAMPIAIYTNFVSGIAKSNFLCKLEKFMTYSAIPLSCGILFLIAVDRFLLITFLNRGLITPFRAKASILFLLVVCLASAIPQSLGFSTQPDMVDLTCPNFKCDFFICQPNEFYMSNKLLTDLRKSVIYAFLLIAYFTP
ncbi:beta-2 adrenergic receptor-like [Watersipora subatra]|uniref:beta-2 adrenergic receptor-like n=1 Tax=Watersipora subatra TaxID=2589382 RepID=UPI00355AE638